MPKRVYIHFLRVGHSIPPYFLFIKQKAIDLGLKGKLLAFQNGEVEIEVEGRTKAIDEFIQFIEKAKIFYVDAHSFSIKIFDELMGYTTMETNLV